MAEIGESARTKERVHAVAGLAVLVTIIGGAMRCSAFGRSFGCDLAR